MATRATDGRWATPLGRMVAHLGVREIVAKLAAQGHHVTPYAVFRWVAGRDTPRPDHARALVSLSGGRLDLGDALGQRDVLQRDPFTLRDRSLCPSTTAKKN